MDPELITPEYVYRMWGDRDRKSVDDINKALEVQDEGLIVKKK